MIIWKAIGLLLLWAGVFAGLLRTTHMLQQNSYKPERYIAFGKTAREGRMILALLGAVACQLCLWLHPVCFAACAAVVSGIRWNHNLREQKKAIKPLVFTARVKRLWVTAGLLALADLAVFWLIPAADWIALGLAALCYGLTPLYLLLCLLINTPLEKGVAAWYVADAKKRLKAIPDLTVIGVTGSYGKTTTKFMIARLLSEAYTVTVTPESFNTPMGVVRTIREQMKPGTRIFIAEMGAKKVGDIAEICRIVSPDAGVITSVGPQHLDTFHSLENVVSTKFELADAVARKNGRMFLNTDSQPVAEHPPVAGQILCGESGTDYYYDGVEYAESGVGFTLHFQGQSLPLQTRLLGKNTISDLALAAAVALSFGVSPADVQFAASRLQPTPHRLEVKSFAKGALCIDDAYNANPVGCLEAVAVLSRFEGKKKIIVTPGLVELGEKEAECNRTLGEHAGRTCDEIYLVGLKRSEPIAEGVRSVGFPEERLHVVASFKDAMAALIPTLDETCVVLLENDLPDNYLY